LEGTLLLSMDSYCDWHIQHRTDNPLSDTTTSVACFQPIRARSEPTSLIGWQY
jgi:hypothetical protein